MTWVPFRRPFRRLVHGAWCMRWPGQPGVWFICCAALLLLGPGLGSCPGFSLSLSLSNSYVYVSWILLPPEFDSLPIPEQVLAPAPDFLLHLTIIIHHHTFSTSYHPSLLVSNRPRALSTTSIVLTGLLWNPFLYQLATSQSRLSTSSQPASATRNRP